MVKECQVSGMTAFMFDKLIILTLTTIVYCIHMLRNFIYALICALSSEGARQ